MTHSKTENGKDGEESEDLLKKEFPNTKTLREIFNADLKEEQRKVLDYFLNRKYPEPIPLESFSHYIDWQLADLDDAVENSERLLNEKFKEPSGEVVPFEWRNQDKWGKRFTERITFNVKRAVMLGDVAWAWVQTGDEKLLDLFVEFYEVFDTFAPLVVAPLELDSGNAAFYGGPDPNLPWKKESWGFYHNPMNMGFRLSRYFRIWGTGIFRHLPVELGFKFLKRFYESLMSYESFIEFPYMNGNHYLFEVGVAPYIAASFFPEFPECRRLKKIAKETINNYCSMAILDDGSYQEHCAFYDLVTFTDILLPLFLARQNGEVLLSGENFKTFRKTASFMRHLFHPNGEMLRFGDSDPIHFDCIKDDLECLEQTRDASDLPIFYPEGGYAFLGRGASRISVTALNKHFDKAHMHWEHLCFEFCSDGVVWIGDPTSAIRTRSEFTRPLVYTEKKAVRSPERQFHYSLAAHNGVLIDSIIPGDEPYSEHEFGGCQPRCFNFEFSEDPQSFSATHDLFSCLGINHRRKISFLSDVFFIEDFFDGHPDSRRHIYKTLLHPMPDIEINFDGDLLRLSKGDKSVTFYFSKGAFQAFPNVHLRKYAYTEEETELSFLSVEWTACGKCSSKMIIAPGKFSQNDMNKFLGL